MRSHKPHSNERERASERDGERERERERESGALREDISIVEQGMKP
jgi:hypothetical protein